jgi:hypothetical protein
MNNFGRLIATVCCSCIFSDTAINLFSKRHPVTTSEEAILIGRRILTLKYPGITIGNPHKLTSRRSYNIPEAWVVYFQRENSTKINAPFLYIRINDGKILKSSWISC